MKNILVLIIFCILFNSAYSQRNITVNKTKSTPENAVYQPIPEEPTICINPTNVKNIIAGANIDYYYYTFDGGLTWGEGRLPGPVVYGDPVVYFDKYGTAYYTHLGTFKNTGIYISKSTNGGKSWSNSSRIYGNDEGAPFMDKQWIISDITNSQYKDNIYIGWTVFDKYESHDKKDSSRILFVRSTDLGVSFSQPISISDIGGDCLDDDSTVEGAVPCVSPEGDVYIAWSGPRGIEFDRSTDGGLTFGKDKFVTEQVKGWAYDIPGLYRSNGLPFTACDVSNSRYKGTIYINFSDERYGDHDIFIIKSTDKGISWNRPVKVNNDKQGNKKEQFMSHFCVDPVSGIINVLFYDRRNYVEGSMKTDIYLARSTDGGISFKNIKVSKTPFTPKSEVFFGDYIGISSYNNMVTAIWMRMDEGVLTLQNYTHQY
jgi:hypothetical protein